MWLGIFHHHHRAAIPLPPTYLHLFYKAGVFCLLPEGPFSYTRAGGLPACGLFSTCHFCDTCCITCTVFICTRATAHLAVADSLSLLTGPTLHFEGAVHTSFRANYTRGGRAPGRCHRACYRGLGLRTRRNLLYLLPRFPLLQTLGCCCCSRIPAVGLMRFCTICQSRARGSSLSLSRRPLSHHLETNADGWIWYGARRACRRDVNFSLTRSESSLALEFRFLGWNNGGLCQAAAAACTICCSACRTCLPAVETYETTLLPAVLPVPSFDRRLCELLPSISTSGRGTCSVHVVSVTHFIIVGGTFCRHRTRAAAGCLLPPVHSAAGSGMTVPWAVLLQALFYSSFLFCGT